MKILFLSFEFLKYLFQAIDKWLRKKEFKPQRQVPEYLQRRQERIRDRIKETMEEQKKQQQLAREGENATSSSITITPLKTVKTSATATVEDGDDDIMIIDQQIFASIVCFHYKDFTFVYAFIK